MVISEVGIPFFESGKKTLDLIVDGKNISYKKIFTQVVMEPLDEA